MRLTEWAPFSTLNGTSYQRYPTGNDEVFADIHVADGKSQIEVLEEVALADMLLLAAGHTLTAETNRLAVVDRAAMRRAWIEAGLQAYDTDARVALPWEYRENLGVVRFRSIDPPWWLVRIVPSDEPSNEGSGYQILVDLSYLGATVPNELIDTFPTIGMFPTIADAMAFADDWLAVRGFTFQGPRLYSTAPAVRASFSDPRSTPSVESFLFFHNAPSHVAPITNKQEIPMSKLETVMSSGKNIAASTAAAARTGAEMALAQKANKLVVVKLKEAIGESYPEHLTDNILGRTIEKMAIPELALALCETGMVPKSEYVKLAAERMIAATAFEEGSELLAILAPMFADMAAIGMEIALLNGQGLDATLVMEREKVKERVG